MICVYRALLQEIGTVSPHRARARWARGWRFRAKTVALEDTQNRRLQSRRNGGVSDRGLHDGRTLSAMSMAECLRALVARHAFRAARRSILERAMAAQRPLRRQQIVSGHNRRQKKKKKKKKKPGTDCLAEARGTTRSGSKIKTPASPCCATSSKKGSDRPLTVSA